MVTVLLTAPTGTSPSQARGPTPPWGDSRACSAPRPSRIEAIRPLYFLHIPRTAGTALTAALDNRFAAADIFPGSLLFQLVDVPASELSRYRFFRGHFGLVLPRLLDWRLDALTVLREPAAMVTSLYAFIRAQSWHPLHHRLRQPGYGLSRFLRDPMCRVATSNWQARWLAAEPPPGDLAWATVPSDVKGWEPQVHHRPLSMGRSELLERSAATIERLSIVGVTERLLDTMRLLANHLGWPPPEPPAHLNVSRWPHDSEVLSADDLELLGELNQVDAQLHDLAWQRLEHDLRAAPQPCDPSPGPRPGRCDYDCSMPLVGRGWRPRAFDARFGWYRWSGPATESVVELPVAVDGPCLVEAHVVAVADPDLLTSLAISVGGVPVSVTATAEEPGVVYRGTVDVVHGGPVPIVFRVPRTAAVADEDGFGLALTRIRLSPIDGPADDSLTPHLRAAPGVPRLR